MTTQKSPHRAARLLDRVQQIRAGRDAPRFRGADISRRRGAGPRRALGKPSHAGGDAGLRRRDGRGRAVDAGPDPPRHRRAQRAGRARLLPRDARDDAARPYRSRARSTASISANTAPASRPRTTIPTARSSRWSARPWDPTFPSSRPSIFTPISPSAWSRPLTSSSAIAPTRISTCASAAPRRRRPCARCWAASARSAPSSAYRSYRRPSPC